MKPDKELCLKILDAGVNAFPRSTDSIIINNKHYNLAFIITGKHEDMKESSLAAFVSLIYLNQKGFIKAQVPESTEGVEHIEWTITAHGIDFLYPDLLA